MATGAHNGSLAAPPPPFRQTSPQIIELREGGGWVAIVGLPFVLAGVVMALTVAGLLHIEVEPTGKWTPLVLAGLSVAFIAGGAVMLFGRRWLTIDASRECIVRSYGLLVPLHTRERSLSEFNAVVIVHQAGDSDSGERYPVRLRSITGRDFVVSNPTEFGPSRSQAEYLSFFLRLPLVDTSTDHYTVIEPERAARACANACCPAQPRRSRRVRRRCAARSRKSGPDDHRRSRGRVLASGNTKRCVSAGDTCSCSPRFCASLHGARPRSCSTGFYSILVAVFIVPTIVASVNLMVGSKRKRATVTASAAGLEIVTRSGWRTRTTQIAGADLLQTWTAAPPPTPH